MSPGLRLEAVHVAYKDQSNWIIDGLDLQAQVGQCIGIIGPNGKGKSTFAHAVVGVIPHVTPGYVQGSAWLCGENIFLNDLPKRLSSVGYSFQDTESQILFGTVADVIGIKEKVCNEELLRIAIGLMRIEHLMDRTPDELSGGEMQRIALITALRQDPTLIIYDEATSALDPQARRDFKGLIEELKQRGYIVLLLGQQNDILAPYCDVLLTLYEGKLVENIPSLYMTPNMAEAFWINLTRQLTTKAIRAPKLSLQGIQYSRYGTNNFTLGPIDLFLESGETIAILGPNGSGKTTLFHLLGGAMKPSAGILSLDGIKHKSATSSTWSKVTTIVSQSPLDQIISGSIREELNLHSLSRKVTGEFRIDNELTDHFPFLKMDEDPLQLSHGQQRMLAMISAFLSDHSILLIDEPEQGFDALHLQYIKSWLGLNKRQKSKTVLFATHDFKFAAEIASKCLLMMNGQFVAEISTQAADELEEWYFAHIQNANND